MNTEKCVHRLPARMLSQRVKVLLVGAGGTGSRILERLVCLHLALVAKGHPGGLHVTVVDPDTVSAANIGRQAFYPGDIGCFKADVLVNRANMALGTVKWESDIAKVDPRAGMEGFDLVIRLTEKPGLNLVARKLAPIRYVVSGSPAYFERKGIPQTPHDLTRHNCLFYAYQSFQDHWGFEGPEGLVSVRIRGNFQVNSSEAIREALLGGLGVSLVPTFTVGRDLKAGILKSVMNEYRSIGGFGSNAYAVYLPNRHLSPKVRAFVDYLVDRIGPEPYWDE